MSVGSITGIVVITIGILVSVALHEVGHMLPAKKFGVLVPDYAVGFGPALWKKKIAIPRTLCARSCLAATSRSSECMPRLARVHASWGGAER